MKDTKGPGADDPAASGAMGLELVSKNTARGPVYQQDVPWWTVSLYKTHEKGRIHSATPEICIKRPKGPIHDMDPPVRLRLPVFCSVSIRVVNFFMAYLV